VSWFKPFKDTLAHCIESWKSRGEFEYTSGNKVKPPYDYLVASWVRTAWNVVSVDLDDDSVFFDDDEELKGLLDPSESQQPHTAADLALSTIPEAPRTPDAACPSPSKHVDADPPLSIVDLTLALTSAAPARGLKYRLTVSDQPATMQWSWKTYVGYGLLPPCPVEYADIPGNGHCGYAAVAVAIYGDARQWKRVRRDLMCCLRE
jgi:hypothetical protein